MSEAQASANSLLGFIPIAVILFILVPPYWMIFKKAGYRPALSLLMLIPLVNFILLWWFATANWPNLKLGIALGRPKGPEKGVIYTQAELDSFSDKGR